MYVSWLTQARACAYYIDGFGVGMENMSKEWREYTECSMWYYLIRAAEAGEI